MLANTPKTWAVGTAVLALVVLLASWFLVVAPQRAEAADLRQQAADIDASNAALAARIAQLESDSRRLPVLRRDLAELRTVMPQDLALSQLTRQLTAIEERTGVVLVSIGPGTPVLDDTAAPAGTPTTTTKMPVTLQVVGPYADTRRFLDAVQTMARGYLVTGVSATAEAPAEASSGKPATANGDVTMTIVGSVFVLPDATSAPAASAAPTAPATAAATPAAGPAETPAATPTPAP